MEYNIKARLIGEFIGSMILVMAAISPIILFTEIIGTGIAIAVLADAIAVGFILFALIEIFEKISWAHFNPAVTLAMYLRGMIKKKDAGLYVIVQITGGIIGIIASHVMFFDQNPVLFEISEVSRSGGTYIAEVIGTFFLVFAIFAMVANKSNKISLAIGTLVGGMIMATSSTMFANPQVTIARIFTYSAAGVMPFDALVFIIMEVIGAVLAVMTWGIIENNKIRVKA